MRLMQDGPPQNINEKQVTVMARSIGLDVLSIFFKTAQIDKHIKHTHIEKMHA